MGSNSYRCWGSCQSVQAEPSFVLSLLLPRASPAVADGVQNPMWYRLTGVSSCARFTHAACCIMPSSLLLRWRLQTWDLCMGGDRHHVHELQISSTYRIEELARCRHAGCCVADTRPFCQLSCQAFSQHVSECSLASLVGFRLQPLSFLHLREPAPAMVPVPG